MEWIWCNHQNNVNEYAEFYGVYVSEGGVVNCKISCDGDYVLFVNGRYAASNQYGDFEHYKIYDTIDLTQYSHVGENKFAVLVWHFGRSTHRYICAKPGVCFEVREDGNVLLNSGAHILARLSRAYASHHTHQLSRQLGFSFLYDATQEDDWINGRGCGFTPALVVDKRCTLFPRPTEKLRFGKTAPMTILHKTPTKVIIDLGKEWVGIPVLKLFSECRQTITIGYAEALINGEIKTKFDSETDFSFQIVVGRGKTRYINYMLRLGCRYLEVISEKPVQIEYVGVLEQYYPTEPLQLNCKDELVCAIDEICMRTLRLCMLEHYVDCPWREQGLYTYDARNQMLCGYYAFKGGNFAYARANLLLMAQDSRPDGLLSITFPCGTPLTIPSYSLYYLIAVKEYVEYSGDDSLISLVVDKCCTIFNTFLRNMQDGAVMTFTGADKWNFYDWTPVTKGTTGCREGKKDLILNALFILAAESLQWLCERKDIVCEAHQAALTVRECARGLFFRKDEGLFALWPEGDDFTVMGNSLAVLAGIASQNESIGIAKALVQGGLINCSLSMKGWMYDVLLLVDKEHYREFVLESIRRDYSQMLAQGATTAWETLDGIRALGGTGSLCHGWSAMPVYYYRLLMGEYQKGA